MTGIRHGVEFFGDVIENLSSVGVSYSMRLPQVGNRGSYMQTALE